MRNGHLFMWDVPDKPGTRTWHYMREAEGQFSRLSMKKYRQFFENEIKWPGAADNDGFAHMASFVVRVRDRKPRELVAEHFSKHRLTEDGFLDEAYWFEGQRCRSEAFVAVLNANDEYRDRFVERRMIAKHGWMPTEQDVPAMVDALIARGLQRYSYTLDTRRVAFRLFTNVEHSLPVGADFGHRDLVELLEAQVVAYDVDDQKQALAGRLSLYRVKLGVAVNNGINAYGACQHFSQELGDYASAILDRRTGYVPDRIMYEYDHAPGDLLILHTVRILPNYRGRDLGLVAASQLIDYYGGGGYVLCRPRPLQFANSSSPPDTEMAYDRFKASQEEATAKLQKHWARIGFQPVEGGEFYLLNSGLELPEITIR